MNYSDQQYDNYQQPYDNYQQSYDTQSQGSSTGDWTTFGNNLMNLFTQNPIANGAKNNPITNFVTSNDYIYQFVFVFFIIVICIIVIKIFMSRLATDYEIKSDIILLNGTVDAQFPLTISQNINASPSTLVIPSRNRPGGLEFTWSVWVYITALDTSSLFSNVFFKGVYTSNQCNNLNNLTNAPGVYLLNSSETNSATLYIFMDTFTSPGVVVSGKCDTTNAIKIPHIPMNEWIHICFGCREETMDVYINGIITSSVSLVGTPKQNNGDIYIAQNKGFQGKIASLRYISHKLSISEILKIYKQGPNFKEMAPKRLSSIFKDYLSFSWYTK